MTYKKMLIAKADPQLEQLKSSAIIFKLLFQHFKLRAMQLLITLLSSDLVLGCIFLIAVVYNFII